jgi:hypothetical protein
MDVMTGLSLAGTIVQFVDFGTRLLSDCRGLYKSSTGVLDPNQELELVTDDLHRLINKLRLFLPTTEPYDPRNLDEEKDEEAFKDICDGATKVAEDLLRRLNKLKVNGSKHRKLESLQQAVRSAWSKREIINLVERLSGFRRALDSRVLFSIRQVVNMQCV